MGVVLIQVNIAIMRAFVRLREIIGSNKILTRHLAELEKKYDARFCMVFDAIRELMKEPKPKSRWNRNCHEVTTTSFSHALAISGVHYHDEDLRASVTAHTSA